MTRPVQDLGEAVLAQLKKLGLSNMPSNYDVFYHAMSGSDPNLHKALNELGPMPSQSDIDDVADEHFAQRSEVKVIHNAQRQLSKQIGALQTMASAEAAEMRTFSENMSNVLLAKESITQEKAFEALGTLIKAAKLKSEGTDSLLKDYAEQGVMLTQVRKELEEARREALSDRTTGALNRRAFDDALTAIYESKDYFQYSLVMLDIDHFKKVNDTYGHPAGDRVLQCVAAAVKQNLRDGVPLYRYGGEEFGFILRNLDSDIVGKVADRIRIAIQKMGLKNSNGTKLNVTISLGFCMADQADSGHELMEKADQALYASKALGRNQVTDFATLDLKRDTTTGRYEMYHRGTRPKVDITVG